VTERPAADPSSAQSLVDALVAEGCDRQKATTIAVHVRTVLWPMFAAARSES